MALSSIPQFVIEHYEIHEWRHATAILQNDFPNEWNDVMGLLNWFKLYKSEITTPGGNKSSIADKIDAYLAQFGWREKSFKTGIMIDDTVLESPTHKVDCYKNKIGLEIEWNNKDPFFDRDLNNFRLLFELRTISVGIILTRCDELQAIFNALGRGSSYGASTTHMSKLIPRLEGGGGGGCPILVFGMTSKLYVEDIELG